VKHNNNGRFIVVCGDGEYIIYTSQALRNKAFGSAIDFCWSATATGDYAVKIKLMNCCRPFLELIKREREKKISMMNQTKTDCRFQHKLSS
jgi:hypothetical protein